MGDHSIIKSVEKAAQILDLFMESSNHMLTLQDIQSKTNFSKTSTYRFCNTLNRIGYLEKIYIGNNTYYRLGIKLLTLGGYVTKSIDITERAKKHLIKISNELGDNSYLFIERNNQAYCIDAIKGGYYIQTNTTYIGDSFPFNRGGGPLALLAYMETSKQQKMVEQFQLNTEEEKLLYDRLELIRNRGYSFSKNETFKKTTAIGVPVFDHNGIVTAAFSVGGISSRFNDERLPKVVNILKKESINLSKALGWQPDTF